MRIINQLYHLLYLQSLEGKMESRSRNYGCDKIYRHELFVLEYGRVTAVAASYE